MEAWLESLELEEYTCVFHSEGYKSAEDMEHLKELTVDQLKAMGIQKTGVHGRSFDEVHRKSNKNEDFFWSK